MPSFIKDILKTQKSSGDCRFWIVYSTNSKTGDFLLEAMKWISSKKLMQLKEDLHREESSISDEEEKLQKKCKDKQHQYLELSLKQEDKAKCKHEPNNWTKTDGSDHKIPKI